MTPTTHLTKEEIEAFLGLEESYKEMVDEQNKNAPRCHMRPMMLLNNNEESRVSWWECSYCGHVKEIF